MGDSHGKTERVAKDICRLCMGECRLENRGPCPDNSWYLILCNCGGELGVAPACPGATGSTSSDERVQRVALSLSIPDVIGLDERTARTVFRDAGLEGQPVEIVQVPATGAAGFVVSQEPDSGTAVKAGDSRPKISELVVLPYVRGIPEYLNAAGGSFGLLSQDESHDLGAFQAELNQTIKRAVAQAQRQNAAVHFAATVEDSFLPDHTICSSDSYLKTSTGAGLLVGGTAAGKQWTSDAADITSEPLHPTVHGHKAISRAIVEWSLTEAPLVVDINVVATCSQQLQDCTFAPNTPVAAWLHSVPDAAGNLRDDSNGALQQGWILPSCTMQGNHRLSRAGVRPDDEAKAVLLDSQVSTTGTNELIYLAAVGVACLMAAGVVSPMRHQKPAKSREGR